MKIGTLEDINSRFLDLLEASTHDECDQYYLEINASALLLALHILSEQIKRGTVVIDNGEKVASILDEVHEQLSFKIKTIDKKILINKILKSYDIFKSKISYNPGIN